LIIGKSGSGKSASLRNFKPGEVGIINVMGKPLPFKTSLKTENTTSYSRIMFALKGVKVPALVIDDAGYLITHEFMTRHANVGTGNAVFAFYNELADQFYSLIRLISEEAPPEIIVYLLMHEDKSDAGDIKPKTIGKLLDEKVCLEGLFTVVLRAVGDQAKHVFMTQSSGFDVAKSPIGMFDTIEIDNDLRAVDIKIREYYNIKINAQEASK